MTTTKAQPSRQTIEKTVEIAAPLEAVWKALTNPEELTRWFPLQARLKPGAGGSIWLSWGPGCEGEAQIAVWEPNRRFQYREPAPASPPVEPGQLGAPGTDPDKFMIVDWTLETRGGKTVLRLVNSGFAAAGADWENEYFDSVNYGWSIMLVNLRHYLERHAGQPRLVAWPRFKVEMPREAIYKRLAAPQGIFAEGAQGNLREAQRYSLQAALGELWSGKVEFVLPPRGFCVTVESLNNALAWLAIEGAAGKHEVQLWFSTYGLPQAQLHEIDSRWTDELKRILA